MPLNGFSAEKKSLANNMLASSPSTSYIDCVKRHVSLTQSFVTVVTQLYPALEKVMTDGTHADGYVSDVVLDVGRAVRLHMFADRTYRVLPDAIVDQAAVDRLVAFCSATRCTNRFRVDGLPGCRVSLMPTLTGYNLTLRLARLDLVHEFPASFLRALKQGKNVLIFGAPGSGKTTCLRSVLRVLDADRINAVAVDQSDELAVDGGTRVCFPEATLAEGILEVVRNHTPAVVVLDEIVSKADVTAVMHANDRGVQLIATTHASSIDHICSNPLFVQMNGGRREAAVGDQAAEKVGGKFLVERRSAPTFSFAYDVRAKKLHDLVAAIDKRLAPEK